MPQSKYDVYGNYHDSVHRDPGGSRAARVARSRGMFFFTADTHFGHRAMVERRGFVSVEEMDATLVHCWNRCVGKHDIIYHLGDVSFHKPSRTVEILSQLNGQICLIKGNHDRIKGSLKCMFHWVKDYHEIKYGSRRIMLSHYPFETWNKAHYGSWHLHGHSHGSLKTKKPGRMDVGVDTNDLFPYSVDEIAERLSQEK